MAVSEGRSYDTGLVASSATAPGDVTAKLAAVSGGLVDRPSSNLTAIDFAPTNSADTRTGAVVSNTMRELVYWACILDTDVSNWLPLASWKSEVLMK